LVAGPTRLELATSGVTGRRSNQLNYDPASAFALARFGATRASGPAIAYLCKRAICHTRKIPAEPKLANGERRLVGGKGLEPLTAGV
jgi:hypothetical protein